MGAVMREQTGHFDHRPVTSATVE